jgi:hypothetical protein
MTYNCRRQKFLEIATSPTVPRNDLKIMVVIASDIEVILGYSHDSRLKTQDYLEIAAY